MQTLCPSLQTGDTNAPSLNFYRLDALPNAKPTVKALKVSEGNVWEIHNAGEWSVEYSCCECSMLLSALQFSFSTLCMFVCMAAEHFFVLGAKPSFARTSEGLNAFCCAKLVVTEYHNC